MDDDRPVAERLPEPADTTLNVRVVFRRCEREDLRALEWFGLFTPHRTLIRNAFTRQQRGEVIMLVADMNGAPIGQVWIDLTRKSGEHSGFLSAVRVFPWFRGLGLGRRLIEAAEHVLCERGFARAEIGVEKENGPSLRFFGELGYHVTEPLREEYAYKSPGGIMRRVKVDQWLLAKSLASSKARPVAGAAAPPASSHASAPGRAPAEPL